jgi:hypothetical protein
LVTEPSGQGPFAEAMRELIAELRPVRGLRPLHGMGNGLRIGPTRDAQPAGAARSRAHLKLVR